MKVLLEVPELYHSYQRLGGFFGARLAAFKDYIDFTRVQRIFDIGCGPGHISQYIPSGIEYLGFDTDRLYIDYANKHFGKRARFLARTFDESVADDYGQPDLILMNGVLHHMNDAEVRAVVAAAAAVLSSNGVFFSLDGCFATGQNPISRFLLNHDRGEHIRTAPQYRDLVATAFPEPSMYVREDLSWVPYTFALIHASKSGHSGARTSVLG